MSDASIEAEVRRADTPIEYNVTMIAADTEYSQVLPVETKGFMIHTRDESLFRFSFTTGRVAGPVAPWTTVLAGKTLQISGLKLDAAMTVYFGSPDAGKIIEIIVLH